MNMKSLIETIIRIIKEETQVEPTKYTYLTMKPYTIGRTKKFYFNDVVPVNDPNPIDGKIKVEGSEGDFVFDKNSLKINKIKNSIGIDRSVFYELYPTHSKTNKADGIGINSKNIKLALQKAFPENWLPEDKIFSAGIRNIYTIGEKINNANEDWSIMNFFDTKAEIHNLIYLKYFDEDVIDIDIVDWMADVFKNDKEFTQLLVDRQWQSIKSGVETEERAIKTIVTKLKKLGEVIKYPFGSKMDRFGGVDFTLNGVNCQIKPLSSYKKDGNDYIVSTYGMRDYKNKTKLNKIVFYNDKTCLIFDNRDYDVVGNYKVTFYNQEPIKLI